MKRTPWMTAAAFALTTFAPAARSAPVPGEKSPLAAVPAAAPAVIHFKTPEALVDHAVAFLKNAVPDRADFVEKMAKGFLENGVDGRKLRGIAKNGDLFAVVTELPAQGGEPKGAFVVPVTSYAEFRDNILKEDERKSVKDEKGGFQSAVVDNVPEKTLFLLDRKDYAVVTPYRDVAEAFAGVKAGGGLDGAMSKAQAAKLLASDVGVYLSMDVFNKQYAEQIKAAREAADGQLKQLEETIGKAQKAQFETVRKLLPAVFQAVEDSKGLLLTLEMRPGGVSLYTETEVRAGSPTADLLKGSEKSSFKDLARLPAGDVYYTGMDIGPAMLRFVGSLMTGYAADPDSKGAKAFAEAFDEWTKAGPKEGLGAVTYPLAGLNVTTCADPEKAAAAGIKMLESIGAEGAFQNVAFKDKPEVKRDAEKYKDVSFTSVHLTWDFDKMFTGAAGGAALPEAARKQMAEGMRKMLGEDMNMWFGVEGKSVVQVIAKDWESARKILDQRAKGEGGVGDEKAFAAARKELPEKATALMLIDVVQYTGVVLDFVRPIVEASGAPAPAKFPKPVKGKPGFVGFAVTLEPDRAGSDLIVTAEAVRQIYEGYVSPLLPKD